MQVRVINSASHSGASFVVYSKLFSPKMFLGGSLKFLDGECLKAMSACNRFDQRFVSF